MSGTSTARTAIDRPFAGRQRRRFRLRLGEMAELERICGAGIGEIMVRLATHRFKASDIRETIRLGLEGGGTPEPEATALVLRYVDDEPLSEHLQLAADIISAAVSGIEPPKAADHAEPREPGDLAPFYGLGAAIGFAPDQVDGMTLAGFQAAVNGYIRAHAPSDQPEAVVSQDEFAAVLAEEMAAGRA